jgi:hypothetical protein
LRHVQDNAYKIRRINVGSLNKLSSTLITITKATAGIEAHE